MHGEDDMRDDIIDPETVMTVAEELCGFAPRMWDAEAAAAADLGDRLDASGVPYTVQEYDVVYPTFPVAELEVDGETVECLPSGLESGDITGKTVIDNLHVSDHDGSNINFNPVCPGLSKPTFYDGPALTVKRGDIHRILEADEIRGRLEVERERFTSQNIIVGTTDDPDLLIFTHYDSWWGGFLDNAFSVATLLHLAPHLDLDRVCIVFAGSEEFSDEDPYWCYGYRQFEKSFYPAVRDADRIAVVDTIGRGETQVTQDRDILAEALVLHDQDYMEKTDLVIGEFDRIMEVYHSPLDTRDAVTHRDHAIATVTDYLDEFLTV